MAELKRGVCERSNANEGSSFSELLTHHLLSLFFGNQGSIETHTQNSCKDRYQDIVYLFEIFL
jgi:hypothetical protein